ncbi:MAG: GCN5-related N-acetyltransferase [Flavipsychrobacter sp.]|jgi:RimJ/RimL family protein N-acetyltransferase|nr:GCN5-related N-acetyltransferase [Flavipsychrobacter sp.]
MNIRIETDRLVIRPLEMTDETSMFEMDSDPGVHRYLGNHFYTRIEQSRDNIAFIHQQYRENGIGRWAVEEKTTGNFVGWVGFKLIQETINEHVNFIDFGYRLMQKHWNKGYASEAGRAALDYGLNVLGYKDIYAMTDIDNGASRRVLEKLGFHLVEIFPYNGALNWREVNAPTTWYKLGV